MTKIEHFIDVRAMRCHDAAYILEGEDPTETLIESVIQTLSTTIILTIGEIKMHLAAWQDPEQWEDDWREQGIDPADVAGLVASQQKGN